MPLHMNTGSADLFREGVDMGEVKAKRHIYAPIILSTFTPSSGWGNEGK